ncbi:tail completion protein gp17 [Paenibacillus apiarius]|uniref:tail completion protein gp17 n=1 Tax=Paenibacillus apiarius TaxID=46240 RepID=UPI003B3B240D
MINLKPKVLQALRSNTALVSILGGQKVWPEVVPEDPKKPVTAPYVTFFEVTNFDRNYAEDQAMTSEIHYQIDVWSPSDTGPSAIEVNKTMEEIGFVRTSAIDRYDTESKLYRKVLRYKTIVRR